jgi:hypothetical protein
VAQDDDFYETTVFWLVFYGYPYSLHYSKSSLSGERERDKIKDLKGTTQEMVV